MISPRPDGATRGTATGSAIVLGEACASGGYRVLYHLDHEARIVSVAAIGHRRYIDDDES